MQARVVHGDDMMATGLLMDTTCSAGILQYRIANQPLKSTLIQVQHTIGKGGGIPSMKAGYTYLFHTNTAHTIQRSGQSGLLVHIGLLTHSVLFVFLICFFRRVYIEEVVFFFFAKPKIVANVQAQPAGIALTVSIGLNASLVNFKVIVVGKEDVAAT